MTTTDTTIIYRVHEARIEAERQALRNLADHKFVEFGHWAAQWSCLNRVAAGRLPNPFRFLVEAARDELNHRANAVLIEAGRTEVARAGARAVEAAAAGHPVEASPAPSDAELDAAASSLGYGPRGAVCPEELGD